MIVSQKIIRKRIKALWPKCRNVWLLAPEFEYPTLDEIKAVIANDITDSLVAHGNRWKCNNYASLLSAMVALYRADSVQGDAPGGWPFGEILVKKHRGKVEKHSINICVLETDIILIEPQDDSIWVASPIDDDPFFIKVP